MNRTEKKENTKPRIGIIFGGRSSEHEVSLMSAASVIHAMDREKFDLVYLGITGEGCWKQFFGTCDAIEDGSWEKTARPFDFSTLGETIDFALPVVHGPYCEDGKLQGLLEMADIPYGGSGVLASAVAMDKIISRDIFKQHGLPVCRYTCTVAGEISSAPEKVAQRVEETTGYPCFVKPANMGSSVGISKAGDRESLKEALKLAAVYDRRVVIEEAIDCREIETAVIGNDNPQTAEVGEIISSSEFYDYSAKYENGGSDLRIPAAIDDSIAGEVRSIALKAYKLIDCEGYARVDFFVDRNSGRVYLNEINTIPGFTKYSMFPRLWEASGLKYTELLERIIELGYERYYDKNNR